MIGEICYSDPLSLLQFSYQFCVAFQDRFYEMFFSLECYDVVWHFYAHMKIAFIYKTICVTNINEKFLQVVIA